MARSGPVNRPGRSLLTLAVLLAVIFGVVGAGTVWGKAQWTPKLALDLEGGTQIILNPVAQSGGKKPTAQQITEAVNIIRQRVDGSGVSESEVTTQGADNIVVNIPGEADKKTLDLVKQSAEMVFRPVLYYASAAPEATATATPSASSSSSPSASATKSSSKSSGQSVQQASPSASSTSNRIVPQALVKAAATTDPSAAGGATTDPSAASGADGSSTGDTTDANSTLASGTASDLNQITEELYNRFTQLTCTPQEKETLQATVQDPKKPIITCDADGGQKYILGPVEVYGKNLTGASFGLGTNQQGGSTGDYQVNLTFDSTGSKAFANTTERLAQLTGAQNMFAIVLDNLSVSAAGVKQRIPNGQAEISGGFNATTASQLASQLKFGALPLSFKVQTQDTISAVLGAEQLERGLLAGLIGLVLVLVYSLLQYRGLGLVTVFSLVVAAALSYGMVLLLSWQQGYRLSLPGVTGLIVSIGVTADSFIVFFERVRDEVREGRPLKAAVETGWARARRTILVSDTVSLLAAVVLYFLAVGGVKGFAFTLGLTTAIDVIVVFLFTKPMVTLLARSKFFGEGHAWSGFSPEQLGRLTPAYAGRGRVREPGESIAARRAAAAAARDGSDDDGTVGAGSSGSTSGASGRDA